ncbi:MAG: hypothetical protein KIT44_09365, partial [Opitutaceae bacterium]|nr:hypothetical protein [Opitutaceae bacterium]
MNSASRLPQPGTSAWNRLNPKAKKKAHDLRRALAGVIELHLSGKWDRATLAATGLRDYRAVIGHAITPGHFWRLFDQVIERDGGRHQFDNLALYLPGRLARQAKPAVAFTTAARDLPNLKAAVLNIADNTRPTQPELLLVWDCACNDYQHLLDTGYTDLRARRAVLAGLDASGLPLALTPAALRRTFCRRLDRWIAGGCTPSAIQDQRLVKRPGPLPLSDEEQKHLLGHAVVGGLSKAWRDCIRLGKISPKTAAQFITNPASKSYVPNRIRAALGPTIKMIQPHHLGPHHARMEGAHISSDPTSLRPGDIFSSDDVTNDLYWWQSDPSGKKATKRGQVLLTIDFRTGLILAFALLEEQYTGSDIRGMVATMNKGYGLPRLYMKFEPGVWKKARVIAGSKHEIPGMETELGLREYMDIRYTLPGRPTGKSMVERTIGLIQQRLKQEVGYCGPNEMRIRYESLHRLRLDVDAGRVDPEGRLYSKEQWLERLAEICEEHNQERQDGKYLRGRSPRQAWDEWYDHSDPLTHLSGPALWLLQNHRRPNK